MIFAAVIAKHQDAKISTRRDGLRVNTQSDIDLAAAAGADGLQRKHTHS
jgi:hypothetical protein